MADRGLITCYSQPVGKANMVNLGFVPEPAQQGVTTGVVPNITEFQAPNALTVPANRGTADVPGQLPTGSGAKIAQYWG